MWGTDAEGISLPGGQLQGAWHEFGVEDVLSDRINSIIGDETCASEVRGRDSKPKKTRGAHYIRGSQHEGGTRGWIGKDKVEQRQWWACTQGEKVLSVTRSCFVNNGHKLVYGLVILDVGRVPFATCRDEGEEYFSGVKSTRRGTLVRFLCLSEVRSVLLLHGDVLVMNRIY
jgi:hypothetical protein